MQGHRCPRCNKRYDFWTKDGRLTGPFHPLGECKAPTLRLVMQGCEVCGGEVDESRPGYGKSRTCSTRCRNILDAQDKALRRAAAIQRADRKRAEREAAAKAGAEWFEQYKQKKAAQ
jgi:predicted nucleic acid-binding Zn ribbon protein